jgi:hypothetical protein
MSPSLDMAALVAVLVVALVCFGPHATGGSRGAGREP